MVQTNFQKSIGPSKVCSSCANSLNLAKLEFINNFMHFLDICKFEEDPIRMKSHEPNSIFPIICLWEPKRASNTLLNSPIWSKIKLIEDFMPIFIISKFVEDPLKIKSLYTGQQFPHYTSIGPFGCYGNQSSD